MGKEKISKITSILSGVEMFVLYATIITLNIINRKADEIQTYEQYTRYVIIQAVVVALACITSIVIIVITAVMMKKNVDKVKGLGFLLASGIILFVFTIIGYYVGIICLLLVSLALKNVAFDNGGAKKRFADQLKNSSTNIVDSTARDIGPASSETVSKEASETASDTFEV